MPTILLVVTVGSLILLLVNYQKYDAIPTALFSGATVLLSYFAYLFSENKFRLELFDKRWTVYEETLKFCSAVTQNGSLKATTSNQDQIASALKSAESSFRGIGLHKSRALFGPDIHQLFDKLNDSYSWLVSFSDRPPVGQGGEDWPQKHSDHIKFMWDTVNSLPETFKPYMYFGDIRKRN